MYLTLEVMIQSRGEKRKKEIQNEIRKKATYPVGDLALGRYVFLFMCPNRKVKEKQKKLSPSGLYVSYTTKAFCQDFIVIHTLYI